MASLDLQRNLDCTVGITGRGWQFAVVALSNTRARIATVKRFHNIILQMLLNVVNISTFKIRKINRVAYTVFGHLAYR